MVRNKKPRWPYKICSAIELCLLKLNKSQQYQLSSRNLLCLHLFHKFQVLGQS